jgi:transposase-like protein
MPWRGVTVSEQRQRFLQDYQLCYYGISDLAERFSISRKTAYKWIDRFVEYGEQGYQELSRRPHICPWQTDAVIVEELVKLRKAHPRRGWSSALGGIGGLIRDVPRVWQRSPTTSGRRTTRGSFG